MKKIYAILAMFLCIGLISVACASNTDDADRYTYQHNQTVAVTNDLTDWHADVTVYYQAIVVYFDGEFDKIIDTVGNEIISANGLPFKLSMTPFSEEPIYNNFPEEVIEPVEEPTEVPTEEPVVTA